MKKYKLTTQDLRTHNGFQWVIGEAQTTYGASSELCNSHWLHYYHSPLLAVLLNPIHANIRNPKLFEIKATGKHLNDLGLKGGCTNITLVKEIELPKITLNQKIAFGILCSLEISKEENYIKWAKNWLNNTDRSKEGTANYAAYAANYAAYAAAYAAYAVNAVNATAYATAYATAANAAAYAAYAAYAANYAAYAAAYAANNTKINLIKLAEKALTY